jgi:hypothetical protein
MIQIVANLQPVTKNWDWNWTWGQLKTLATQFRHNNSYYNGKEKAY